MKLCHWTKASLTKGVGCYKQTFYGIESHRCLQMTPAVDACNLACQFCWRTQEWGSNSLLAADDPAFIVDESIRGQRELLTGYKGNPNVSRERFLEAWHPTNVAISLTGEPTLYKRLGEMIDVSSGPGSILPMLPPKTRSVFEPLYPKLRPGWLRCRWNRLLGKLLIPKAVGAPRKAVPVDSSGNGAPHG